MDRCQFGATAVLKQMTTPAQVQAQAIPLLLKLSLSQHSHGLGLVVADAFLDSCRAVQLQTKSVHFTWCV